MNGMKGVNWPLGAFTDTGEDGMSVIAYWPSATAWGHRLPVTGLITRGHDATEVDQVFPGYMSQYGEEPTTWSTESASVPLGAFVVLGATRRAIWDVTEDRYWQATLRSLTSEARRTVEDLDRAFGRKAVILTHLHT